MSAYVALDNRQVRSFDIEVTSTLCNPVPTFSLLLTVTI